MYFDYSATDAKGKNISGKIEAYGMREAIQKLRGSGLIITNVHPAKEKGSFFLKITSIFNRVSSLERVLITRHLALLLRSGVNVDRALDIISRQVEKKFLKKVMQDVLSSVRKGESLASAMGKHEAVFPKRYVAMVQWGEAGGSLSDSLEQLSTQLEHDRNLMSKVKGALTYPALIFSVMIVVGVLMSIIVLPQLINIVQSFNVELPLPTKIFIFVASFIANYALYVLPIIVLFAVIIMFFLKSNFFKPYLHAIFIYLPVFGGIIKMVNLARLNRALSSLVHSGIPLVDALAIASDILGNVKYKEAIKNSIGEVRKGVQLSASIRNQKKLFPSMEVDMIQVGEESGKLSDVLMYLAKFYESEVNKATKNMAQLIEPIMLVVVGIVVGGIVFAVLMPIYQLSEAIV